MSERSPRLRWWLAAAAGIALLVPPGLAQQAPPSPPPSAPTQAPQPTGTGRVTVHVVAADNGAAVKRARVTLMGMMAPSRTAGATAIASLTAWTEGPIVSAGGVVVSSGTGATAASLGASPQRGDPGNRAIRHESETDQSGTCIFTGLPAATYSLMVMPQGGFVRPSGLDPVRLQDGGSQTVTVRLARTGAIVGRVTDESGEPVLRAQVRALRREPSAGRRLMMTGSATTDDLGQFRLFDLQPGEYYVSAELTSPMGPMAPAGSGPRTGLAPTFYPGSPSLDGARSITVKAAQDAGGVEFSLVTAALGSVTGSAVDTEGKPLTPGGGNAGVNVQLSPRGDSYWSGRGAVLQQDGTFAIRNVPPGDYYLSATLFRGQGRDAYREGAFVPITVNGDDVSVDLHTNTGATVSGTVVFEGQPPAGPVPSVILNGVPAPRVSINVRPAAPSNSPVCGGR